MRPALAGDLDELAQWEARNDRGAGWNHRDLSEEWAHAHSSLWVAHRGEALMGYMAVRRMPDGYELMNILVPPGARRRGVASALLEVLHGLEGAVSVFLEVRASNTAALGLYRRLGYEQVGVRHVYYRDGEDAVLMTRDA